MRQLSEAETWLRERGIKATYDEVSVEGVWTDGLTEYEFQIGPGHGCVEVAIRPQPEKLTWWIHSATLEGLLNMLFEAQADVVAGRFPWLEALKARDPVRWMDPDFKEPEPG